MVLAALKAQA